MNGLPKTAATLASLLLMFTCLGASAEESTKSSTNTSPSVVEKVEKAVKRGANATARGIERGAKATAKGIKRGADATARGVQRGANATGKAVDRVINKEDKSPAPPTSTDK